MTFLHAKTAQTCLYKGLMSSRESPSYKWVNFSDNKLLEMRFCDLNLKIEGSFIEPHIKQVYQELEEKGIRFKPHFWISEEWFTPDGVPGIAVPFYLVHKRLARLHKKMLLEVEGASPRSCMKILRHEVGHALDNAYKLRLSKQRQKIFGLSTIDYPEYYSPKAYSRQYVVHLDSWYAQAHPDEDWAETFATWMTPGLDWRKRYRNWPALNKLKFVDEFLKAKVIKKRAPVQNKIIVSELSSSRRKLSSYYKEKRDQYGLDQPFFLEPLLYKLFSTDPKYKNKKKASVFIKEERKLICSMISKWTGQYSYTINLLLQELIESCQEKDFRLSRTERETRLDLMGMLTAQTLNYISNGFHKIPL